MKRPRERTLETQFMVPYEVMTVDKLPEICPKCETTLYSLHPIGWESCGNSEVKVIAVSCRKCRTMFFVKQKKRRKKSKPKPTFESRLN